MGIGGLAIKVFNKPEVKKMLQEQVKKYKSEPTIVDVTVPKKKYSSIGSSQMGSGRSSTVDVTAPKKKYASIGSSQMRSGRSSTIQTSSTGLMSKASIGKKTLLGG